MRWDGMDFGKIWATLTQMAGVLNLVGYTLADVSAWGVIFGNGKVIMTCLFYELTSSYYYNMN